MPSYYDDAQYGVVERMFFKGQQVKLILVNDSYIVKRYYPKGPIRILKFGVQHIATQGGTQTTISFRRDGSTLATVIASTDAAPWRIASKSVNKDCAAGSYLLIQNLGTVATGSVICFMDFYRKYSSKWDN